MSHPYTSQEVPKELSQMANWALFWWGIALYLTFVLATVGQRSLILNWTTTGLLVLSSVLRFMTARALYALGKGKTFEVPRWFNDDLATGVFFLELGASFALIIGGTFVPLMSLTDPSVGQANVYTSWVVIVGMMLMGAAGAISGLSSIIKAIRSNEPPSTNGTTEQMARS